MRWHDISVEGYPIDTQNCLLTDGKNYYVGYWRSDAKAWDNPNSGWVREYIAEEVSTEASLAKITHWSELPKLP